MSRDYEFDDDEPFVVIEKQSGTLSSFLVGIAIGAGLALLFAPQSGVQTRRGLQRRARRARFNRDAGAAHVSSVCALPPVV